MLQRRRGRRHAWDLPSMSANDKPVIIARGFHSEMRFVFDGEGLLLSDFLLGVMVDNGK